MAIDIAGEILRAVDLGGVWNSRTMTELIAHYHAEAGRLCEAYRADCRFNRLAYYPEDEGKAVQVFGAALAQACRNHAARREEPVMLLSWRQVGRIPSLSRAVESIADIVHDRSLAIPAGSETETAQDEEAYRA